jgi:hypothetical protein
MKKIYIVILMAFALVPVDGISQCTNTTLDWDYRDFWGQDNTTITSYVSLARCQSQPFAFGANKLTITHNYSGNNVRGENTTHTGSAGSNGTSGAGADVQFTGNGTITLTFRDPVTNLAFSLFDIDRSHRVQFSALNGATPVAISLARVSGTTLTFTNNNSTTARVDASTTTVANTSTDATVNVTIAGPVTSVTMVSTLSATCSSSCGTGGTEDRSFWLSDISGCTVSSFPNDYYVVSRPFTGMPGYVITVRNNVFYYVDPATGRAKYLFTDPGHSNINSVSYDPYRRYVYYTYSLSGNAQGTTTNPNERSLRRYHYDLDTFGVLVPNVNTLGIPTYENGVETAAAAFYDDHLYLGIEGGSSLTESNIWRIELNAAQFPIDIAQVYSQPPYIGSTRNQDWSDFGINNGVLYDFDAGNAGTGANKDFFNQSLYSGAVTRYLPSGSLIPRQVSVDWTGQLYNVGSPSSLAAGTIAPYNGTNNVGTAQVMTYDGVTVVGSWGDAGEAFRPFCDFGDAPESYDPDPWSPAVHERDTALRLGPTFDREWLKSSSIDATADGSDEDGIQTVPLLDPSSSTYNTQVTVYNNTDTIATVMGWLDYNGNGLFDPSEASDPVSVLPGAALQTIYLNWSGISSTLPVGAFTYLRIRVASARYTMDNTKATGYYDGGETEDYRVVVDNLVLPVKLNWFDARSDHNAHVKINWMAGEEIGLMGYEIERSHDGNSWETIAVIPPAVMTGANQYEWLDRTPIAVATYYRLKIMEAGGKYSYSDIRMVKPDAGISSNGLTLYPNPATSHTTLAFSNDHGSSHARITIITATGKHMYEQATVLSRGMNRFNLPLNRVWPAGVYYVQVKFNNETINKELLIRSK